VFGNSPVPNLIAGWFSFIIAALFRHFADQPSTMLYRSSSQALSALASFMQRSGAFGR
jgi:hypothetical protein